MKNIIILAVIFIFFIISIMSIRYYNYNKKDKNIVENFPRDSPLELFCTDIDGDLFTTSDITLSNLAVESNANFNTDLTVNDLTVTNMFSTAQDLICKGNHVINDGKNQTINGKQTIETDQTLKKNQTINGTKYIEGNLTCTSLNILPSGSIVMWNSTTIPEGWKVCDGTNSTPNMSGKFVLGYGTKSLLNTGGEENVSLSLSQVPPHSHSYHNHGGSGSYTGSFQNQNHFSVEQSGYLETGGAGSDSNSHNNMPPYFVLLYIMKI